MTGHIGYITIEGVDDLYFDIIRAQSKIKVAAQESLKKSTLQMRDVANGILYSRTRVAALRDEPIGSNWESDPKCITYGQSIQCQLHNYSPHWRMVEFGTGDKASGLDEDFPSPGGMIKPVGDSPLRFQYQGHWYSKLEVEGQEPIAFVRGSMIWAKSTDLLKRNMIEAIHKNGLGEIFNV